MPSPKLPPYEKKMVEWRRRRLLALSMRRGGATFQTIGDFFGVSRHRAMQMVAGGEKDEAGDVPIYKEMGDEKAVEACGS